MKHYFSPSRGGFFNDMIHGACEIAVVDEVRQKQALQNAIAADQAAYDDALLEAVGDAPQPDRDTYRKREIDVLVNPIGMMIPNPDCRLPDDAIEVSEGDYEALFADQARGMMIVAGAGGAPQTQERPIDRAHVIAGIRRRRNAALRASDWTELPKARLSTSEKAQWKTYRDALFDFPALATKALDAGTPLDQIIMPTPPE